jgi:hypothetical protein
MKSKEIKPKSGDGRDDAVAKSPVRRSRSLQAGSEGTKQTKNVKLAKGS